MAIKHGVDMDRMKEFVEYASNNPSEVQFELQAQAVYDGKCAHSMAKIREYRLGDKTISRDTREFTIPYGAWKEVLEHAGWVGATDRMEPIEVALSALASCLNAAITINALANGVDIEHLEIRVHSEFNPAVLFGIQDLDARDTVFSNIRAEIECEGADREQIEEWVQRSPVYTLTSLEQDIQFDIEAK
ncbi:MAG: OsmC family protein [Armatimonadota bacterium]